MIAQLAGRARPTVFGPDALQPSTSSSVAGNSLQQLLADGAVAGRRDLANAAGEVLADAGPPAQARLVHVAHRLGRVRHDVGGIAIGADLERILALQLEQVGDLAQQRARDGRAVSGVPFTAREAVGLDAEVEQAARRRRPAPRAPPARRPGGARQNRQPPPPAPQTLAAFAPAACARAISVVDRRRRDAGCEPLAVLPFGRQAASAVASQSPRASASRIAAAVSRIRSKQSKTCAIAVDVPLGDLPVVGAGVARLAGVAEDDARFELLRVDVERRPAGPRRRASSTAAMPPYIAGR